MGHYVSKEAPKPDVDLLPPKFERRTGPLERLPLSPFEYMFGQEKRDRLFSTYFVSPDTLAFRASMRPDYEQKTVVGVTGNMPLGDGNLGESLFSSSGVVLGFEDTATDPMLLAQARIGADGSARGCISGYDLSKGLGAYALIPVDTLLVKQHSFEIEEVGRGIGGQVTRYTHRKHDVRGEVGNPIAPTVEDVTSPRSVNGPAAESSGVFSASSSSQKAVLPEVGMRYISPDERYSFGVHGAPANPFPFKMWMVGAFNGAVTAGFQLSSTVSQLKQAVKPESVAVDAAISWQQAPIYEMSLALDGRRQELVAGFVQNLTIRRKVYNVFEASEVKGIYNYFDWGFEMRRPLAAPNAASLAVAASWQANKNLLFKGRIGTRDASLSASFKSWWDPAVTLTSTATYDRAKNAAGFGLFISVEQGGALEYQKAIQGYQTNAQALNLRAQAQLNEKRNASVDPNPYAPPPVGARPPITNVARPSQFL